MKPEPLKDKPHSVWTIDEIRGIGDKKGIIDKWYNVEDIRLAIRWLKKEIDKNTRTPDVHYPDLLEWIDEAFQDVIKK